MTFLTVAFPTFNGKEDTRECLDSLARQTYPKDFLEVIIVDNGSRDGLKEMIEQDYPWVKLYALGKNMGFASGVNFAVNKARGEWIFVTNQDVVLGEDTLEKLVTFATTHKKIATVGPKIMSYWDKDKPSERDMPGWSCNFTWGIIRSLSTKKIAQLTKPVEVDWLSGAGFLLRKNVAKKVGYFEDRLFAYWEDADFGLKAKKVGYKNYLVPQAVLWHKGSQVLGVEAPQKVYYLVRNGRFICYRHFRLAKMLQPFKDALFLGGSLVRFLIDTKHREVHRAKMVGLSAFYMGQYGQRKIP